MARELKSVSKEFAEVLLLRQQLSKSSVKKYTAMKNAACKDNRERGMFRFYGANRTGRFAGNIDDWLDQFKMFFIYEILPEILELWGANLETEVQSKKTSKK